MTLSGVCVVHVLPADLARGAQLFARTLRDMLDGRPDRHRTLALFASPPGQLRPDISLGIVSGRSRDAGLQLQALLALRRSLIGLQPDLVVAHGGEALKYSVLARPSGAQLVYTKTGVSTGNLRGPLHVGLYRRLARAAAMVVAVSEESADEAESVLRMPASRVSLIPNGRDPDVYRPGPLPSQRVGPPRLLFLGHLNPTKDPDRFVEVVQRLRARGLEVSATIVGDGPLLDALLARGPSVGVQVLGRRDDAAELLRSADVLVFPGWPEGEGMPGVFIEAGLSALPVVATDVPGARTVVDHGVTGLVVPLGDLDALVDAVMQLVGGAELRARMGVAARRRCVQHWSLATVGAHWQALFDRVLGRSTGWEKSTLGVVRP